MSKEWLQLVLLYFAINSWRVSLAESSRCYDEQGRAQMCWPQFENIAYGKVLEATNTCGIKSQIEFCTKTDGNCFVCNNEPSTRHPTSHMTDFEEDRLSVTWWQSETMLEDVQSKSVNLTLHLNKAYDISYIKLRFESPRPESLAILKKINGQSPWSPYHYFSGSCEDTYGVPLARSSFRASTDDLQATCTNRNSISPLSGGSLTFSVFEGMALNQRSKPDWTTATDIRIVLSRLNTFGDEIFGEEEVLKSYFYAISDLSIGGRCKCNGHAESCKAAGAGDEEGQAGGRLVCACEHHTTGDDCQECLPFYNDQPWRPATNSEAHECQACDCNGRSTECTFNSELYRSTGHGGYCVNCREHTAGQRCHLCEENYYREGDSCVACQCHPFGSSSPHCDEQGQCLCKPGVSGQRCDRCKPDHFGFGPLGCSPCDCNLDGIIPTLVSNCEGTTGQCICKPNVDGRQCNVCSPGFYNLNRDNPNGCMACLCHGHSSSCTSATGYYKQNVTTRFSEGMQSWSHHAMQSNESASIFYEAPDRYLGDQRFSYNQKLSFHLYAAKDSNALWPFVVELILEGSSQKEVRLSAEQSVIDPGKVRAISFRLHEYNSIEENWLSARTAKEFVAILSSLKFLKIKLTYRSAASLVDKPIIDNIQLESASRQFGESPATWVETCACPQGYIGQFCESCQPGYTRDPPNGGPDARCVPCRCNNHADTCQVDTGRCTQCKSNTEGDNCERCKRGYYGNATDGTEDDCAPCPCSGCGPCQRMADGNVLCLETEQCNADQRLEARVRRLEESLTTIVAKHDSSQAKMEEWLKFIEAKIEQLVADIGTSNTLSVARAVLDAE